MSFSLNILMVSYLNISHQLRILYFAIIVIFLSLNDETYVPGNFLTGRRSVFNQVFVKWSWGWTLLSILALKLSCWPLIKNWKSYLFHLFIRLLILTFVFYLWCQIIFPQVEHNTGKCVKQGIIYNESNMTKYTCKKLVGYQFIAFDISGHTFLLIYCILCIMAESRILKLIYSVQKSKRNEISGKNEISENTPNTEAGLQQELDVTQNFKETYSKCCLMISFCTFFIFILSLLWDVMLIVTTLFYHTFVEKILGAILSMSMWYILYKVLFVFLGIL